MTQQEIDTHYATLKHFYKKQIWIALGIMVLYSLTFDSNIHSAILGIVFGALCFGSFEFITNSILWNQVRSHQFGIIKAMDAGRAQLVAFENKSAEQLFAGMKMKQRINFIFLAIGFAVLIYYFLHKKFFGIGAGAMIMVLALRAINAASNILNIQKSYLKKLQNIK